MTLRHSLDNSPMSRSHCMVKEHGETTQHMLQQQQHTLDMFQQQQHMFQQQLMSDMFQRQQHMQDMLQQFIGQQLGEFYHKIENKIQSLSEKTTGGNGTAASSMAAPNARRLQLKFLNQVSDPVFTGKEIKGEGDNPVTVAIVDETERVINSGPASSAKVEIVLREANADDNNGNNQIHQDFKSADAKIHFAKPCYVSLQKGIGDLTNAKLAQDSKWTKSSKCQLVARVVENLSGIEVQEARTEPFMISDSRKTLYGKRYPPSLSNEVWRLVNIARGGAPCKRLEKDGILTVQDFLFLNSVNPERLHEIIGAQESFSNAVKHAQTCVIDDTSIYKYADPSEPNVNVVFDVVGKLKGVIDHSQHVHPSHLSESLKARASTLLSDAFKNRSTLDPQSDAAGLMQKFQLEATNAAPNTSIQGSVPGCCNKTLDSTLLQSEAQKVTSSTYERCEEVNSNYDYGFSADEIFLEDLLKDVDMADNVVYSGALPPNVVSNESQFCTQESQPGGSVSNPNTGTAAGGKKGMLGQFPRDLPEQKKPRTRRQEQRMAGNARRPRWKQDEPRLSLRLRSRAQSQTQGLHLTTRNHGEESSSRGLPHGFRGRGGDRDPGFHMCRREKRKRN